ncbi:hypothetical protein (plasmid) [Lactobacillus brevis] [Lactiplantibacillus mudanjiangensis]|uniref:LysM peptidoglycan-binding domain-containing protein n=1 Tax=Lactiplantibacillus mudanjiangensis TaxID=1296538 RepID=UPI001013E031|nr:LysM domain-containing protein [Lactiplantibacillus mudanjiangensis]VDG31413.1 hypothetical protein (plasmid) [Lactobacillus brevis] [Lactiplantibacillus mudanjiangensis]
MATKKKAIVTKGKSTAYLKKHAASAKAVVKTDAQKITKAKGVIDTAKKQLEKVSDQLNTANGYRDQSAAYQALTKQIETAQAKMKTTKTKKERDKYAKQIKSLTTQRAAVAATMRKIANSAGYAKAMSTKTRADAIISNTKQAISDLKDKKVKDTKKYTTYKTAYNNKVAAAKKALQRKNSTKIQTKIKVAKKSKGLKRGFSTAIYRADLKTSRVFLFGEASPNETDEQDLPTHPVDKSDPRINYGSRNSKQLSGTYYLHGSSFSKLDAQFVILQGWARKNVEVVVRGFSKWNHAYLASVSKTMDEPYKDTLAIQLTLQYAEKAHIKYAKKSKKKSKASASKKKGSSKSTKKYVTVKAGMTYWGIAQKYNVSVSSLEKMNKWPARVIPVGVKVRYV